MVSRLLQPSPHARPGSRRCLLLGGVCRQSLLSRCSVTPSSRAAPAGDCQYLTKRTLSIPLTSSSSCSQKPKHSSKSGSSSAATVGSWQMRRSSFRSSTLAVRWTWPTRKPAAFSLA